jgi:hypothetical protein
VGLPTMVVLLIGRQSEPLLIESPSANSPLSKRKRNVHKMCTVARFVATQEYEGGHENVPEYESAHKMCTNRPPATRFDGYDEVGFGPVLVGATPAPVLRR